jgi:hypothetical protein
MREDFKEQIQIEGRVVRFRREASGIFALPLFQPRVCRAMIESVAGHHGWNSAKVSRRGDDGEMRSVVDPSHRTASLLFSAHLPAICRKFDAQMNGVVKPFVHHIWRQHLTEHEGTQLVRYSPGGHYIPHSDVGRLTMNRYYSVLCYLNDDFEGGSTQFPNLDYSVTPRSGKAVIFPSSYLHGGEPVTSGEKYILVTWITGTPPED